MRNLSTVLALALLAAPAAQADILIALDQTTLTGTEGDILTFKGIISNTGTQEAFLNGDSLNLDGIGFTMIDLFFNNVPLSLLGGQSSLDIALFQVRVNQPFYGTLGPHFGSYTLLGGLEQTAQDQLATVSFQVNTVPEPRPYVSLAFSCAALLLVALFGKSRAARKPTCRKWEGN